MALAQENKDLKDKVEQDYGFEELKILRELSMSRVRPPKTSNESNVDSQGRGMLVQWFPQWWGWYSKSSGTSTQSTTFDGELLDALADAMDDDTLLRRDTVFGQFNLAIGKGAVSLCTKEESERKTVVELQFENVNVSYESRSRSGSHKFSISLGALYLHDYLTENSTFPILVQPQTQPSTLRFRGSDKFETDEQSKPLFELTYEKKPLHLTTDHALHVNSRSLDVVYNPLPIKWLINFMSEPHKANARRIQAMKRKTRKQLIKNWEQILEGEFDYRSSWDLQFNISAPQILLVQNFIDSNAAVVVVDFGRLHLSNNADANKVIFQPSSPISDTEGHTANENNRWVN